MSRRISRLKQLARNVSYLRQRLGWHDLSRLINQSGLAPVVVDITEKLAPMRVLVLAPHPDDEAFGCGGALAYHHQRADVIKVIYLCAGDGGSQKQASQSGLLTIRQAEARQGLDLVGATGDFWQLPDGSLRPTPELANKLKSVIAAFNPDRIYSPWVADNHADHMATAEILKLSLRNLRSSNLLEIWQYEIWSTLIPNRYLPLEKFLNQKRLQMDAHASQLVDRSYRQGIVGLNNYRGMQVGLTEPAEAFTALSVADFTQI